MAHMQPLFLKNEKLARSQYATLDAIISITGAKTYSDTNYPYAAPILFGYDAADLTQTKVEAFLNHKSGITCATSFGSTALGTDTLGFVVDMAGFPIANPPASTDPSSKGQAYSVAGIEVVAALSATTSAAVAPVVAWIAGTSPATTTLPNTLASAVGVSTDGDIYGHVVVTGLDAATAGWVHLTWYFSAT